MVRAGGRIMTPPDRYRPTLDDVIEAVGVVAADQLSAVFGGRRVPIPKTPGPGSPLSQAIGQAAAIELGRRYGGEYIDVPIQAGRRAKAVAMLSGGASVAKTAAAVGWTERHIWRVKAETKPADSADSTQLTLL